MRRKFRLKNNEFQLEILESSNPIIRSGQQRLAGADVVKRLIEKGRVHTLYITATVPVIFSRVALDNGELLPNTYETAARPFWNLLHMFEEVDHGAKLKLDWRVCGF